MTDDIRDLFKMVNDMQQDQFDEVKLNDSVEVVLSEAFALSTGVVGFTRDGIILGVDDEALEFLDLNNVILENVSDEDQLELFGDEETKSDTPIDPNLLPDMGEWMETYMEQEDNNAHTENILHLAELVGKPEDVKSAKEMLAKHIRLGSLPNDIVDARSEMNRRLYPKAMEMFEVWCKRFPEEAAEFSEKTGFELSESEDDDKESYIQPKKDRFKRTGLTGDPNGVKPWMRRPEDKDFDTPAYQRKAKWEQDMDDATGGPKLKTVSNDGDPDRPDPKIIKYTKRRTDEAVDAIYFRKPDGTIIRALFEATMKLSKNEHTHMFHAKYKCLNESKTWRNRFWSLSAS